MKRTRLPNGLTVITKPARSNNIVSVVVTLKMGSLYETDDNAGLSTFMQDTVIKGTETRTSEQIALELESMGTRLGTSANREYGSISLQSTSESLYQSLDILFDILCNATFPEDAVVLQKNLQTRNILLRNDQPLYRAVDLLVEAYYGNHPFHKSRLGYPETIDNITRDDIVTFYRTLYVPNNMVVTAVGNFDEKRLISVIKENIGDRPSGKEPVKIKEDRLDYTSPVEKTEERDTAASWFALGWPSATLDGPDYYTMEVLNSITGGSMNSRLFVAIREKRGLAYQVSSFVNARRESGIYVAYIGTKPSSYEEARRVLIEEVRRMASEVATPEEIKNTKSFLKGMNIMEQESNAGQASRYGHYEILGVGYDFADEFNDGIEKVTASDILKSGKKYLMKSYALGGVLAK
ncbi:M16 family metallopeptidase [Candidatus Latescibacterota bacterium]